MNICPFLPQSVQMSKKIEYHKTPNYFISLWAKYICAQIINSPGYNFHRTSYFLTVLHLNNYQCNTLYIFIFPPECQGRICIHLWSLLLAGGMSGGMCRCFQSRSGNFVLLKQRHASNTKHARRLLCKYRAKRTKPTNKSNKINGCENIQFKVI